MQYLLPCECGQKHRLTTAQAGRAIQCSCGATLQAPAFREFKTLERAPDEPATKKRASGASWRPLQGAAFGMGAALVAVSAVCLAMLTLYLGGLSTEEPQLNPEGLERFLGIIDTNTPVQNLEVWQEVLQDGLSRPGTPYYLLHREFQQRLFLFRRVFLGLLAAGVFSLLASFVLKKPAAPKPATPRGR